MMAIRWVRVWLDRLGQLPPPVQGMFWSAAAGMVFSVLNALMRALTLQLDPFQAQFLRYSFGLLVLLPMVARAGLAAYRPRQIGGQFLRGAAHTAGLCLWFAALPRIPMADTTAIGFTGPIFMMIGAWLFLGEAMRWDRWIATLVGFAGAMIVVGPKLSADGGGYHLVMLASAPMFAMSFLITKALTRYESTGVILVWQSLTVSLFSLPMALFTWQSPTGLQWAAFLLCGVLGSLGHWCLTHAFRVADISATQSIKFLDLVWAAALGWLVFGDVPTAAALLGGVVICTATLWLARRESDAAIRAAADLNP